MDIATASTEHAGRRKSRVDRGASLNEIEAVYLRDRLNFVRVAAKIVGDPHEANDAVQDAFAHAVRKRRSFRGAGPLEAWLWRLVVNAAHSHRRRRKDLPTDLDQVDGADDLDEPDPSTAAIRAVVASLPERQRLVLFLRYYADLDYVAIAQALEMRTGTVSSTLSHAHRAIRAALTEADT